MKRILGFIICSGILFALSGCSANASTTAEPSKGRAILVATPTPITAQAGSAAAATPPGARPAKNGQTQMAPGVMGPVISVDGSTITVKDSRQQSNVTVTLTDNTPVFKQATIAMTDVAVGEVLNALGSLNGDVFTAAQILIGVEAALGNAPRGAGQPGGNPPSGGPPPADNQAPAVDQDQPRGQLLSGTVKEVSSGTLTIETASGSAVQVRLDTNGQIVRQVAGTRADLAPNVRIIAMGEHSGTMLAATWIEIIPAQSQSGLFGSSLFTLINGVLLSFPQAFGGNP